MATIICSLSQTVNISDFIVYDLDAVFKKTVTTTSDQYPENTKYLLDMRFRIMLIDEDYSAIVIFLNNSLSFPALREETI